MKTQAAYMPLCLIAVMLLGGPRLWAVTTGQAHLPSETKFFLQQAQASARKGALVDAINSYNEYLKLLTVRDGRDKIQNTYRWILQAEIARARSAGERVDWEAHLEGLAPLVTAADEAKDPISQWRLHLLVAEIALQQSDQEEALQEIDAAIAAYPDLFYPDPARQSSIQYLLNYGALMRARQDAPAGIEWFLNTFKANAACVYVELEPWEEFFKQQGNPDRFVDFYEEVIVAFQSKLDNAELAAKHDSLRYFMRLFQNGLEQIKKR